MQKKRRFVLPKPYEHIVAEALEGLMKFRKFDTTPALSTTRELFVSEMVETNSTTMIASSPPDLAESIHERLPCTGNDHSSIEVSNIQDYVDEVENDDHASCVESSFQERKSYSIKITIVEDCVYLRNVADDL